MLALPRKENAINSLELAIEAARALDERLGKDIRVLDMRGVSGLTDYCVIASGTSAPHLKALTNEVQHNMKQRGVMARRSMAQPPDPEAWPAAPKPPRLTEPMAALPEMEPWGPATKAWPGSAFTVAMEGGRQELPPRNTMDRPPVGAAAAWKWVASWGAMGWPGSWNR